MKRTSKPAKTPKEVIILTCEQCGKPFPKKRKWQKFCHNNCRQTANNKKRDRVIVAAREVVRKRWNQIGLLPSHSDLIELHASVCDLEGWNKEGEKP